MVMVCLIKQDVGLLIYIVSCWHNLCLFHIDSVMLGYKALVGLRWLVV